ncbi:MAG: tetratricopeptide repeat protein [Ignavibacteria bacterium]|nr:tetratricopeptide repeat protein [Ignavibacteria bacterium]
MNIITLENTEDKNKKLHRLKEYLFKDNFKKVIKECVIYLKEYPDEPDFYSILALSYSKTGQIEKAFKLLKKAEKKFPDDYEVLFQMGKLYEDVLEYDKAIEYLNKSFNVTPAEYRDAKADCLNDIGVMKHEQGKQDEAIGLWKNALSIDPAHFKARNNLDHFSDIEAGVDNIEFFMDEFHEFEDVQTEKYFQIKGKKKFDTKEEKKHFFKMLEAVWMADIIPLAEEMKKMDPDKLSSMYRDMEIDYSGPLPVKTPLLDKKKEMILNKKFPFLPENGFMAVLAAGPALDYAGLNHEKLIGFVKGDIPLDAEDIEKLKWAYSIGEVLLELSKTESKKKQFELIDKFAERLQNLLSVEDSRIVLNKILTLASDK